MAGQIKAALYLLARSVYLQIAIILVVVQEAAIMWLGAQGVTYGAQDSLMGYLLPFICCFAAVGIAAEDDAQHGLRAAVCARSGRARYAASRCLLVAVSTALLVLFALALDGAVALSGHPELSLMASAPAMHTPARLLAQHLSVLAWAELVLLVAWLTRRTGLALLVAFVVGIPKFGMGLLLLLARLVVLPSGVSVDVGEALGALGNFLPVAAFEATISSSGGLLPVDVVGGYVVPLVWVVALAALSQALMARRTV